MNQQRKKDRKEITKIKKDKKKEEPTEKERKKEGIPKKIKTVEINQNAYFDKQTGGYFAPRLLVIICFFIIKKSFWPDFEEKRGKNEAKACQKMLLHNAGSQINAGLASCEHYK